MSGTLMRVQISHTTNFAFDRLVPYSIHQLRVTPRPAIGQRIVSWLVDAPGTVTDWTDAFGNQVTSVVVAGQHRELTIRVEGLFDSFESSDEGAYLRFADREPLPAGFWLRPSPFAMVTPAIREFAADLAGRAETDRVAMLHELMKRIHGAIAYVPGATEVHTTAAQALAQKTGVCQDHAHLFIACCRSLGVPARYVSGYLAMIDERHLASASHAWAEAHVPYLGWIGFDPANLLCPTGHYLKVAVAPDYADAAPVTGLRTGGAIAQMRVDVRIGPPGDAAQRDQ